METERALIIPEAWMAEAKVAEEWLGFQPFFRFVPVPGYERLSGRQLKKRITDVLKASDVKSALVVLPAGYAAGSFVKFWPELFIRTRSGVVVTSVCFADKWADCRRIAESAASIRMQEQAPYNATCQYQPPYTATFDLWVNAGARSYHPGDYSGDEFLSALETMEGHWLYWGHSDNTKLRAYNHLRAEDLLLHRPLRPLHSTLWFSCSTLGGSSRTPIALSWYLSGATRCMMAGIKNTGTNENRLLSAALLKTAGHNGTSTLDALLYNLLTTEEQTFGPVLSHYRLMGPPWIKLGTPSGNGTP